MKKIIHKNCSDVEFINVDDLQHKGCDFIESHKVDIEQWNIHDWKNLIGFKNMNDFNIFAKSLNNLAKFYNSINNKKEKFEIFFKCYNKENINTLRESAGRCVDDCAFDLNELTNKGYVFIFFTTQRECYDKNHFLMYMIESYFYDRNVIGHMWNEDEDENDIKYIILNEKW